MTLLVLDASVAAKWVLPSVDESLVEEALDLLLKYSNGEIEFVTPASFWPEFGNILWKAVRRNRWSEKAAMEALRDMQNQHVPTVSVPELLDEALKIAISTGRTVYDSLYVALAVRERAEMITADERLVNALSPRFPVRWLGSL